MAKINRLIFGLVGFPVKHSFSPAMHTAAFKKLRIDAEYKLFEVEPKDLKDFLLNPEKQFKDTEGNVFCAGDISGFNITIPHKVRAKEILEKYPDTINEKPFYAELSGAINTVKREGKGIAYINTDAPGFLISLKKGLGFSPKGSRALVVGCGGAGRAIIAALSEQGSGVEKIFVCDKSDGAILAAKKHFSACFIDYPYLEKKLEFIQDAQISDTISKVNLLVNASPVGMKKGDLSPVDKSFLRKGLYVYDAVYNRQTQLVEDAKSLGLSACCGLGMLLYQGVYAFEFWAKKQAPVCEMEDALKKEINKIC
ncbi:MAG: shikimate dehydrogenase [Candidatus Omnitrophica bacterium]|nr:shikimate dehydrogenase [Candidatus Omnitrophota bacterium]